MINPVAFEIGPLSIRWYALCIVSGLILAVYLAMKEAPRRHIHSDDILDFILIAFPISLVGARLYYVAFQWSYYAEHPAEIIAIWNGGIAIYGGLLAGALVMWFYSRHKFIQMLDFLDVAAPSVMIAQAIGRWGNFVNQEAYGATVKSLNYLPTWMQKQMYIDGAYRQPTFLFESVWNVIGFLLILVLRRKPRFFKQGEIAAFYLIWYGCGRMVIEGMRTDSLMFAGLRVSQWLSVFLILVGVGIILYQRKRTDVPYYQS